MQSPYDPNKEFQEEILQVIHKYDEALTPTSQLNIFRGIQYTLYPPDTPKEFKDTFKQYIPMHVGADQQPVHIEKWHNALIELI